MSFASLRVLLGLDAAEFTTGLTKAEARLKNTEQQVKKFSNALQKDIAFGVGKAVTALAALDRVGGFLIRFGFDAINAAASFEDLGEKTGGSAEKLASFQTAADITKTSMESVGEALVKLTKGLAGADEETKGAANAVQKLGFNLAEFKELDSATQFELLAKRLNEFADSNTKTSAAVQLFGKAGANQLSLMKELANQTERSTILTKAHIKTADDFADKQAKVTSELKQYVGVVGIAVLPVLTELSKAFVDVAKSMTEMDKQTGTLKASNAIRDWAETAAIAIATLFESLLGIAKLFRAVGGSFEAVVADIFFAREFLAEGPSALINRDASKIKTALAERNKIVEEANQRYVDLWNYNGTAVSDALRKNFALRRELERDIGGGVAPGESMVSIVPPKPKLPDWFGGGRSDKATKAAQEAKKLLDKQLSDIDNFIKAEKRIFETRESDLARLYQNDQLSIAAYFDERLAALDRNTTATVDLYDKQIAAQEAFAAAAKRRKDEPAVIDAQKQIGDIQSRIADVLHEKQQRALKIEDERTQSAGDYADQVAELQARLLELLGTEEAAAKAALIRFDIQNRSLLNRARAQGDKGTEQAISQLRTQADSQAKINILLQDAAVIEQNLATAQAKLHLERDLGIRGELESLDLLGKSSGEAAAKLQIIADKYLAIAQADGSKVLIANAEAFKQKINEMAAATDILAAKIRQTFVDTGASAIETFLNSVAEGKNVLDSFANAFKQFANDIIRQINRIAAEKIAASLFKGGSDGGIFGDIADAFVAYIGGLGGRERGGPVSYKTPYIVGERGPEIFVPRTVAAEATRQIDSLIAQRGRPTEYTDRVKAATVATNIPHLIGAKGPEIFVPKVDGIVISNDKVNKLSRVLQRRAKGGPVVSATRYIVGERGPEIFTPRNAATLGPHEKIVTRLVSSIQPKASQAALGGQKTHDESVGKLIQNKKSGASYPTTSPAQSAFAVAGLVPFTTPVMGLRDAQSSRLVPRVVGARGPELFVSKAAGIIIPNDKVAKLASAFERKAVVPAAAVARRREISAPLVAVRTIMRDEKIITRYTNAPYSRRASGSAHVPYIVGERGREIFIPKPASAAIQRDEAISKLSTAFQKQGRDTSAAKASRIIRERAPQIYIQRSANAAIQRDEVIQKQRRPAQATRAINERQIYIQQQSARAILQSKRAVAELVANAPRQRRAGGGPVAARTPYVVGELGPELFMPKSAARIIKNEKAIDDLVSNKIQHRATSEPNVTYILGDREVSISKLASTSIKNEKFINDLVSNTAQHSASVKNERVRNSLVSNTRNEKIINQLVSNIQRGPFAAHQTYLINEREIPKSARNVIKSKKIVDDIVSSVQPSPVAAHQIQRRPFASSQTYLVNEFVPKSASKFIKNEKVIYDLVTNTIQRKAHDDPVRARQTYIVRERGPELLVTKSAEKIIKNESLVSELVTNNARRNEKIINDLVSKTVHHRERVAPPDVAAKIIKNESRISELVSNNVQHNDELINRFVTTTRRENGRANLLIVGAHGPELFIPKAAGNIIKNERRINELVSNIEHRNIDRRSEKNIDEIISSTIQRRAQGGPVGAYQKYLVGERGPELYVPREAGGIKVPSDFFTNEQYRRARGGAVVANRPYIVGERGPETFIPKTSGRIVQSTNTNSNTFVFNMSGGVTMNRQTQQQLFADAAQAFARSNRRLN